MAVAQFQVTLWIELLAAGLGGVQGALFAAGRKDRRIDLLGVIVIGLTVALGGSLLRDIVLNQPPVVVWVNWYLLVAGASAILGMALQPIFARTGWLITVLDAIVMGLFGAIAASKALSLGVGSVGALVVGVIGAIGGGILRDLILNRPISILHVGTLYAIAAGTGAATLIVLVRIDTPVAIAGLISAAVTTTVRLAAILFDWTFPEQRSLRSGRPRVGAPPRHVNSSDNATGGNNTMNTFDSLVSDAKTAMDLHDGEALASLFAPDGRVTDENEEHVGRPAIARWFETTPPIRLETLDATIDGSAYTLIAKGHGSYPGSPLTFRYDFTLGGAGIDSLSISLAEEAA